MIDGRSDSQLCLRIQPFDSLSHDMRSGMPECSLPILRIKGQDFQFTVLAYLCPEIRDLAVYLGRSRCSCQPFADILCNIKHGHLAFILFDRSVFQCDFHSLLFLSFLVSILFSVYLPFLSSLPVFFFPACPS